MILGVRNTRQSCLQVKSQSHQCYKKNTKTYRNKAGNQSILDSNNIDKIEVDEPSGAPGLNELKALPKNDEPSNPPKEY